MLGRAIWSAVTSAVRGWSARRILERARRAKVRDGTPAAARALMRGVESYPHSAELWNALCVVQIEQQDLREAECSARRAIELSPALPQAHNNLGTVQARRGEGEIALASFERALELDPRLVAALRNRAGLLSQSQRVDAAIAAWDECLRDDPGYAEAYAGKGVLMLRAGRFQEARENLVRAQALGWPEPFVTLQLAQIEAAVGDAGAAEHTIASLRGQVEDAEIDWNLAMIRLSRGDFATGWPLYEARLRKSFESPRRGYPFPEWHGEKLAPGELLVMAEQGLGDEIMFASCYPDALQRAPRCVMECDPRLAGLFARSFPEASVAAQARGNDGRWLREHPGLRYQIHAGSLPRLFRTDAGHFPRHAGYLRPNPQRVEACRHRLSDPGTRLKVGIAWNGGIIHTRRELRCVPLAELARLMRGSSHLYVSLQHDDDGTDAARLAELSGAPVRVLPEVLANVDEMAALLCALDVVITVCSSVAHLSGAVGARTWVLTPDVAEWRYLRTGAGLPWYPSVRLYRQTRPGAWRPVIDSVAAELRKLSENEGAKMRSRIVKKLNLGCGDKILPAYINVDVVESRRGFKPDVICDLHQLTPFEDNSIDEILSVHVVEHFWRWEVLDVLREWTRVLKPGGKMILECPNLLTAASELLQNPAAAAGPGPEGQRTMWVFYGDPAWKDAYMVHRWGYTPASLAQVMHEAGLVNLRQEPAQFKLREPRDMRVVGQKPGSTPL